MRKWKESTARGDVGQANNPNDNRCGTVGVQFESCGEKLAYIYRKLHEQGNTPAAGQAGSLTPDEEEEAKNHGMYRVTEVETSTSTVVHLSDSEMVKRGYAWNEDNNRWEDEQGHVIAPIEEVDTETITHVLTPSSSDGGSGLSGALDAVWDVLDQQFSLTSALFNLSKLGKLAPKWLGAGGKLFSAVGAVTGTVSNPEGAAAKTLTVTGAGVGLTDLVTTSAEALAAEPAAAVVASYSVGLGFGHVVSMIPSGGPGGKTVGQWWGETLLDGLNDAREMLGAEALPTPNDSY